MGLLRLSDQVVKTRTMVVSWWTYALQKFRPLIDDWCTPRRIDSLGLALSDRVICNSTAAVEYPMCNQTTQESNPPDVSLMQKRNCCNSSNKRDRIGELSMGLFP